jgi:hypothetical protein
MHIGVVQTHLLAAQTDLGLGKSISVRRERGFGRRR